MEISLENLYVGIGIKELIESTLIWCDCYVQETHNNTRVLESEVSLSRTGCIIITKKRNVPYRYLQCLQAMEVNCLPLYSSHMLQDHGLERQQCPEHCQSPVFHIPQQPDKISKTNEKENVTTMLT